MAENRRPAPAQEAERSAAAEGFPHPVAVAVDAHMNFDTGGSPDETISSQMLGISDARFEVEPDGLC